MGYRVVIIDPDENAPAKDLVGEETYIKTNVPFRSCLGRIRLNSTVFVP